MLPTGDDRCRVRALDSMDRAVSTFKPNTKIGKESKREENDKETDRKDS
jgi:hypothetical protein